MTKLLDNVQYVDVFVQVWEIPDNMLLQRRWLIKYFSF